MELCVLAYCETHSRAELLTQLGACLVSLGPGLIRARDLGRRTLTRCNPFVGPQGITRVLRRKLRRGEVIPTLAITGQRLQQSMTVPHLTDFRNRRFLSRVVRSVSGYLLGN